MLRTKLLCLLLLLIQYTCSAEKFQVKVDTLNVDLKDLLHHPGGKLFLEHAVKFNNQYFCFFEEHPLYRLSSSKHFMIITEKGHVLHNIKVPDGIDGEAYFDLFIRDSRLFVKTRHDQECFYFDPKRLKWVETKLLDDQVYEDNNYRVMYVDFGEWGESTWFIDKKNNAQYVLADNGSVMNRNDGKYYLTNRTNLTEISNPRNLQQCNKEDYYNADKRKRKRLGAISLLGSKFIYRDTSYSYWSFEPPKQRIITSWVVNDQLYQLYSDSASTYVGYTRNGELVPVQKVGNLNYRFIWGGDFYRGIDFSNDARFLNFRVNNNTFGFVEIKGNKIDIRYLKHNVDSLKYLGTDGFDSFLRTIVDTTSKLIISRTTELEKSLGGVDFKTDRVGTSHNSFYPKYKETVKSKEFIKSESDNVTQTTEYLYSHRSGKVKWIFLEWMPTRLYETGESNTITGPNENPDVGPEFLRKQDQIEEIVSNHLGVKPERKDRGDGYFVLTWEDRIGHKISMYGSDSNARSNEIRMIINME